MVGITVAATAAVVLSIISSSVFRLHVLLGCLFRVHLIEQIVTFRIGEFHLFISRCAGGRLLCTV